MRESCLTNGTRQDCVSSNSQFSKRGNNPGKAHGNSQITLFKIQVRGLQKRKEGYQITGKALLQKTLLSRRCPSIFFYQTAQRHVLEDGRLHTRRHYNLKSDIKIPSSFPDCVSEYTKQQCRTLFSVGVKHLLLRQKEINYKCLKTRCTRKGTI